MAATDNVSTDTEKRQLTVILVLLFILVATSAGWVTFHYLNTRELHRSLDTVVQERDELLATVDSCRPFPAALVTQDSVTLACVCNEVDDTDDIVK